MSAFPFDAVIFDMDGVIVDTEYYYLGETAAFAKELGLNLTQEELNGQVGTSHQFFLRMLVDWFERAGKGQLTGEEALARWDEWAHKRPRDYQAFVNPGAVDAIRELPRRGVRVALASSSPTDSIEEVLNEVGMIEKIDKMPHELSGGEQQRVAIARAVVFGPKLILADEPTGNLDSKNGAEVMGLLTELNLEGTTIVMVTHNEHDASIAHRIVRLFDGQIVG